MSSIVMTEAPPQAGAFLNHRLRRWVVPSLSDCLFIAVIVWLFLNAPDAFNRLLADGDTGWHIRTGDYILANGKVPQQDLFSFTKPGEPWFAWEWGADVIYSLLHKAWGLKAITFLGGVQIALFGALLFRFMMWRGSNVLAALLLALVAVGASSLHFLARPHLFSLVLVPACLWILERDRRQPSPAVWWLVPITAVWTNLHGGFMALVACLVLLMAGTAIETLLAPNRNWTTLRRYSILAALCLSASLLNPYGWHLHGHILTFLRSDWIRKAVSEFQSPQFRDENVLQFEFLLFLALPVCWRLWERRRITECLWILFWAHQALGSIRHITVFVAVALPLLGTELASVWNQWVEPAARTSARKILDSLSRDLARGAGWTSLWPAAFLGSLLFIPAIVWPQDFPAVKFPVETVKAHADLIRRSRVLTVDQWGDYLIYRHYPQQRVFLDGRSDFYGQKLGEEYLALLAGRSGWRSTLDRHRVEVILLPPVAALTNLLKSDPSWRLLEDHEKALLFVRVEDFPGDPLTKPPAATANKAPRGLMKYSPASEFSIGDPTAMKQSVRAVSKQTSRRLNEVEAAPPAGTPWNLPSGAGLGEFAMRSGFLAPRMLLGARQSKPFGLASGRDLPPVAGTRGLLRGMDNRQFGQQESK